MSANSPRRLRVLTTIVAVTVGLCLGAAQAQAVTCSVYWTGGHGDNWGTEANWSTGVVPDGNVNVCLDNTHVSGSYTVEVNGYAKKINSLTINGSSGTVTLLIDGQPAYTHGQIELAEASAGGGVGPKGVLELGSTNNEPTGGTHGGVVAVAGTFVNEGTIVSENTNDETPNYINGGFYNAGSLVVQNTFLGNFSNWTSTGTIDIEPKQEMAISAAGESESSTFTQSAGTISNQGIFRQSGGTFVANGGGVISGNEPILEGHVALSPLSGSGSLHVMSGAAKLTSDIGPSYTVWVSGIPGYTHGQMSVAGNLANHGTLELGSSDGTHGTIEAGGGSLTNAGTIVFENTMNGPDGVNGALINDGALTLEDSVIGTGAITNDAALAIPANDTLEAASFTQGGSGSLSLGLAGVSPNGVAPIQLSGAAALAGSLAVSTSGLSSGTYPLIKAQSRSGTFGSAAVSGGSFGVEYTATGVQLGAPKLATPAPATAPATATGSALKGGAGELTSTLSCPKGGASCKATIKVTIVEHLRHGKVVALSAKATSKRTVTIASTTVTIAAGVSRKVTLKLNRTGLALLAKHHTLNALVTIASNGHTTRLGTIRITRPAKKKSKHG